MSGGYDQDTEVLTETGWKRWADVALTDRLATLDDYYRLEYVKPIRLVHDSYTGPMYEIKGRGVDLFVTYEQYILYCAQGRTSRFDRMLERIQAKNIGLRHLSFLKTSKRSDGGSIDSRLCCLYGFLFGHKSLRNTQVYAFIEGALPNIIKTYCSQLKIDIKTTKPLHRFLLPNGFRGWFSESPLSAAVMNGSYNAARAFFHGLSLAKDVQKRERCWVYVGEETVVDALQQLAVHAEFWCDTTKGPAATAYIVHNSARFHTKGSVTAVVKQWIGDVYCAEMATGIVFVRRNGKSVWCG
jgi:hypothetical protein